MKWLAAITVYIAVTLFTFGWTSWRDCKTPPEMWGGCSAIAGVMWPIYWPFKASIEMTKPAGGEG